MMPYRMKNPMKKLIKGGYHRHDMGRATRPPASFREGQEAVIQVDCAKRGRGSWGLDWCLLQGHVETVLNKNTVVVIGTYVTDGAPTTLLSCKNWRAVLKHKPTWKYPWILTELTVKSEKCLHTWRKGE
jgi:hypothetical protein